jgi:hypothetical protein
VGGDGFCARVQALLGQLLAQPDDHILGGGIDRVRAGMRPPGPGLKGGNALDFEAFDQLLHPVPGDPVVAGHLAFVRPSTTTAVMINWAIGMLHLRR